MNHKHEIGEIVTIKYSELAGKKGKVLEKQNALVYKLELLDTKQILYYSECAISKL